jgi:hypothetical protein
MTGSGTSIPEIINKKDKKTIADILDKEKEEMSKELERIKLERLVEEERMKLQDLRRGIVQTEKKEDKLGLSELGLDIKTLTELSKLPDEDRQKVLQTYMEAKAMAGAQASSILPILIGFARNNPNAKLGDYSEIAKTNLEHLKLGIMLSKEAQGNQQNQPQPKDIVELIKVVSEMQNKQSNQGNQINIVDIIKIISEMNENKYRNMIKEVIEDIANKFQPQQGLLDRLLMDDAIFNRLKEVGLFGGRIDTGARSDVDLKLEEMRQLHDLKMQEMKMEHDRWLMQQQMEARKWEQIGSIIQGPVGGIVQSIGKAAVEKFREGGDARFPEQEVRQPPIAVDYKKGEERNDISVDVIACPKCNKEFYVNIGSETAVCPHCGAVLKRVEEECEACKITPPEEVVKEVSKEEQKEEKNENT